MSDTFWQRLNYIFGILTIGVVFGLTAFAASLEVKDLDLWLHLKMGKIITETMSVPSVDIFSCTIAGKPWNNHEWLFQVFIYQIWHQWGFDGLINMQICVVLLTFLILLFLGYRHNLQFLTAFFLLLVLLVYQTRFTIRPDIFSLLFFVSYVLILTKFLKSRWSLWALVIIQVLWTNMHGFFFFGPLLVGIAILSECLKRRVTLPWEWNVTARLGDEEYRRLKIFLPFLLLACCLNPQTFKGAWYPLSVLFGFGHEGNRVFFNHITELQKPITMATVWSKQYGPYKLMIFLSAVAMILNRRKIDLNMVFLWIIFLMFSLAAVRNMVFFAMAAYLVFTVNVMSVKSEEVIPLRFSNERFKYISGLILKCCLAFWMIDSGSKIAANGYFDYDSYERKSEFWGVSQRAYPYHAVNFLVKNDIKGNFFNDFNSGAYLIGRAYPNIKVYMDGRTEQYGGEYFEHYQKLWRDGNKEVFLKDVAKYNLTGVFLNNNSQLIPAKILKMIYSLPDWKIVYFDYDAVIFLRDVPANKAWIDKFQIDLKKWQGKPMDLQRLGTKRIDPSPITRRAYVLKVLGLYDAVLKEAHEAIKVAPDDFEANQLLAEAYENKKDYRKAFEYYRIATIYKPYDTDNRLGLAKAYERLNDYKGAKEQLDRVLEIDPKNISAHWRMAKTYALMNQEKTALEWMAKAQTLAPEDKVAVKKIRDIIDKNKKPKPLNPEPVKADPKPIVKPKKDSDPVKKS